MNPSLLRQSTARFFQRAVLPKPCARSVSSQLIFQGRLGATAEVSASTTRPTLWLNERFGGSFGNSPSSLFHSTARVVSEDGGNADNSYSPGETKDNLLAVLGREHDEEMMNEENNAMPPELVELKTQLTDLDWKIVDSEESSLTRMVRTVDSLKVQVSFHCQDMVESVYDDPAPDEDDEEATGGDDDDDEPSMPIRFTVVASKAGQTMVFGCLSENAAAPIQSVAITSASEDEVLSTGSVPAKDYQGPEFAELAQDLQYAFQAFLEEELGISDDVAAFIAMYADYKEQQQYVKFLERSKRLLS